jgi:hypothetical protein
MYYTWRIGGGYSQERVLGRSKAKKAGRPKLPKGKAKASIVPIRLSVEARKKVAAAARASNQSISEWIRERLSAAIEG